MSYQAIIDFYYPEDNELRRLLLVHSRSVADKALLICDRHLELGLDRDFVEAAAMLHDIGIRECDAPGIFCHGGRPYIQHGLAGAEMMKALCEDQGLRFKVQSSRVKVQSSRVKVQGPAGESWLGAFARVCQRHTGAGITRKEVVAQGLPLPLPDDDSEPYVPETLEEQVICYADKFFSKTRPTEEKNYEQAERSLAKFGEGGLERFRAWRRKFE